MSDLEDKFKEIEAKDVVVNIKGSKLVLRYNNETKLINVMSGDLGSIACNINGDVLGNINGIVFNDVFEVRGCVGEVGFNVGKVGCNVTEVGGNVGKVGGKVGSVVEE